jgi:hypothetical protein
MSKFLSLATGIFCLSLLTLAVFVFDLACLPLNPSSQKNALPTWAEILARKEQLDQLEEKYHRYLEAKRKVAKEVIAGRRSLAEAIEAFRRLDEPWIPVEQQEQTRRILGMSEVEWRGREVIHLARRVLADRPDEEAAVADRLEKERQKLLVD